MSGTGPPQRGRRGSLGPSTDRRTRSSSKSGREDQQSLALSNLSLTQTNQPGSTQQASVAPRGALPDRLAWVQSLTDIKWRYNEAIHLAKEMEGAFDQASNLAVTLDNLLKNDGALLGYSVEQVISDSGGSNGIHKIARDKRTKDSRVQGSLQTLAKKWNHNDEMSRIFQGDFTNQNFVENLVGLANAEPNYERAMRKIAVAQYLKYRLWDGRGRGRVWYVTTDCIQQAKSMEAEIYKANNPPNMNEILRLNPEAHRGPYNLLIRAPPQRTIGSIPQQGFLTSAPGTQALQSLPPIREQTTVTPMGSPRQATLSQSPYGQSSQHSQSPAYHTPHQSPQVLPSGYGSHSRQGSMELHSSPLPSPFGGHLRRGSLTQGQSSPLAAQPGSQAAPYQAPQTRGQIKAASQGQQQRGTSQKTKGSGTQESRQEDKCICLPHVKSAWKTAVMSKKKITETAALSLLKTWRKYMRDWTPENPGDRAPICRKHCHAMAEHQHPITQRLSDFAIASRLFRLSTNTDQIGILKCAEDTYSWFLKNHRPYTKSDGLGAVRFWRPNLPEIKVTNGIILANITTYLGYPGTERDFYNKFYRDGTINVNGLLDRFGNTRPSVHVNNHQYATITELFRKEFGMYLWHQRRISGKANFGWLRTAWFSLIQQVLRMCPAYWLLYVALRKDNSFWLVSYPYYAKYARPGDSTAFRHIDLNPGEAAKNGHGSQTIQGSCSLTDEEADDCTVVVFGMHKTCLSWWEDVKKRTPSLAKTGEVCGINNQNYTKEDKKKYGEFVPVPVKSLGIRISHPLNPHGALGPAKRERMTMLPWFERVLPDHSTLEIPEGGTWEDLAKAHRDLIPGPRTPSGYPNKHGGIKDTFPVSTHMVSLDEVGDALVCRRKWSEISVHMRANEWLNAGRETFRAMHNAWQDNAAHQYAIHLEKVARWERSLYGEKSYWLEEERARRENRGVRFDLFPPDFEQTNEPGEDGENFYNNEEPDLMLNARDNSGLDPEEEEESTLHSINEEE